jgi:pimeloyl-ACP methyl ester carboxylesterase
VVQPDEGRVWNGTEFVTYPGGFDQTKRTLVVVHGVMSNASDAYGQCLTEYMREGRYEQVVGFNYDWSKSFDPRKGDSSSLQLYLFLENLRTQGVTSVDVMAHSYGTIQSLSAIPLTRLKVNNLILQGSPLNGTPFATAAAGREGLVTLAANLKFFGETWRLLASRWKAQHTFKSMQESGAFADLAPNSEALQYVKEQMNTMPADRRPQITKIVGTTNTFTKLVQDFIRKHLTDKPHDGIIPIESAEDPSLVGTTLKYPVGHTGIQCNPETIRDVATIVNGGTVTQTPSPTPAPTPTPTPAPAPAPAPTITVTVSPGDPTLETGRTQQFTATVTGTTDQRVAWSVNSIAGGNSVVGTISATGLYTAPSSQPNPNTVTVRAISLADQTKGGNAIVAIASPCSSTQVAGTSQAVTRSINMGRTSGTFTFSYDTYSLQDRLVVSYQGTVLHDTGCVGQSRTMSLSYAGTSTTISVSVTPNCAGTTGTAWEFRVSCPNAALTSAPARRHVTEEEERAMRPE